MTTLYPLKLQPALQVKLWGGRKIQTKMGISLPTDAPYGEAWLLHDTSTVTNGAFAGQTLRQVLDQTGVDLVGQHNDPAEGFPLLAKFLDALDWLSVQVHPNDAQAATLEGDPRGKTEAWLILAADDNAKLVIGVEPGTQPDVMAQAIQTNTLEDRLAFSPVKPGDVFFVRANTVHAIGPGILIYEIQQSSDITYRLYDWGRVDLDGNPREMHIDKGVQVSNLTSVPEVTHPHSAGDTVTMVECEYFQTVRYMLHHTQKTIQTQGVFHALTCIDGSFAIDDLFIKKGETVLIPACLPEYTIQVEGHAVILNSFQP